MFECNDKFFIILEEVSFLFGFFMYGWFDLLIELIVKSFCDKINSLNINFFFELLESLDIFEVEMKKKILKLVIIKGMIYNLMEFEVFVKDVE